MQELSSPEGFSYNRISLSSWEMHRQHWFLLPRKSFSSSGKLPPEAPRGLVVSGWLAGLVQPKVSPLTHSKALRAQATPSGRRDGRTRLLRAMEVLEFGPANVLSKNTIEKQDTGDTKVCSASFLQLPGGTCIGALPGQLPGHGQHKKSRGHHKLGTFIYATDFSSKERQKS